MSTSGATGFAVAQIAAVAGNLTQNVARHVEVARAARQHGAGFVVFPELSLTGYEPDLARETAITPDSSVIQPLVDLARQGITIVAGAPIRSTTAKPFLAALIITPRDLQVYNKRFLHGEENDVFCPGSDVVLTPVATQQVGIAICADIHEPQHDQDIAQAGATVYAAGVAIKQQSLPRAHDEMSRLSARHGFVTLLANYSAPSGGYDIRGGSGIWNSRGECLQLAADSREQLLLATPGQNGWTAQRVDA
ncbi:MAG: carbon-nitrogen hydrolase family protein [Planctomycetaceae bacterium]|nr:carbon-nitrogen hydrolase family protein [Planctomycetaceae bacterium]